jgi:hypothetical protein
VLRTDSCLDLVQKGFTKADILLHAIYLPLPCSLNSVSLESWQCGQDVWIVGWEIQVGLFPLKILEFNNCPILMVWENYAKTSMKLTLREDGHFDGNCDLH